MQQVLASVPEQSRCPPRLVQAAAQGQEVPSQVRALAAAVGNGSGSAGAAAVAPAEGLQSILQPLKVFG